MLVGPIDVGGRFSVWLEIVDRAGTPISTIDSATKSPRNRVIIKNKCGLPKSVKVDVSLMSGNQYIEFTVNGSGAASWSDSTKQIASMGTATVICDMAYKTTAGNLAVDVQFDKLSSRPGTATLFSTETDTTVPFALTIQVA